MERSNIGMIFEPDERKRTIMILRLLFSLFLAIACEFGHSQSILTGADQTHSYIPLLLDKKVGVVVNQTSLVQQTHLVDSLQSLGISISQIFAPEHGFRGHADAGEHVKDGVDQKSGIRITSLYGNNKKPNPEQLSNLDIVLFDIQDVGARFYTYISTMHYVMEACAEEGVSVLILDRPNPNGHYVAGPVLDTAFRSFVGMHPIPIVHGLTVGELANMINDQGWLKNGVSCDLTVIECQNYNHTSSYSLPVKPSPNLPNDLSIKLYPSLCLFEASMTSIGRGTRYPFQVVGHPDLKDSYPFSFIPKSIDGMSKSPKHENVTCYGLDFRSMSDTNFNFSLQTLINFYKLAPENFITNPSFFNKLAGNDKLINQLSEGVSLEEIELSWEEDLTKYKKLRKQYLLYPDFE